MDITKYSAFFLLSTVKFLFTPFGGPAAGLTFFETYLSCVLGAFVSGTIFYFLGEFLLKRSKQKNLLLRESAKLKGEVFKEKKKFTSTAKRQIGMANFDKLLNEAAADIPSTSGHLHSECTPFIVGNSSGN